MVRSEDGEEEKGGSTGSGERATAWRWRWSPAAHGEADARSLVARMMQGVHAKVLVFHSGLCRGGRGGTEADREEGVAGWWVEEKQGGGSRGGSGLAAGWRDFRELV